jgi:nickel-dependent lactate racemase
VKASGVLVSPAAGSKRSSVLVKRKDAIVNIDFPYPGYEQVHPVEVRDEQFLGVFSPHATGKSIEHEILAAGLANPLGGSRLRDAVRTARNVLILVDDGTRNTPTARFLPLVLDELRIAGIADDRIEFLQSPGTHRAMTDSELQKKLGDSFGKFKVHEHDWLRESSLRDFGRTRDGTRVTANALLPDFDFIMGLGSIVPHRIKGFSGGAKIAFPGVSGRELMERNQWQASMHMAEAVMGVVENPMRLRIEEAARLVRLQYIVNVVVGADGTIAGCFCGDVVAAHRRGCQTSRQIYGVHLPSRADVVMIDSYPADRDFWQSAKAFYTGSMAVRTSGTLILVSPNPEGIATNHPLLLNIGYRPSTEIVEKVQRGKTDDLVGMAILHDVCQIVDRIDCILVSPGVKQKDAEKLGFRHASTTTDALEMAIAKQGASAKVAVLRHGGHILPIIDGEASERGRS